MKDKFDAVLEMIEGLGGMGESREPWQMFEPGEPRDPKDWKKEREFHHSKNRDHWQNIKQNYRYLMNYVKTLERAMRMQDPDKVFKAAKEVREWAKGVQRGSMNLGGGGGPFAKMD